MSYFTNSLLIFSALVFSLVRGNAKSSINTEKVRNIVVVQMAQLGDMVCTTHVFHHIKKKYPHAKLYVIGKAINRETLEGNKDIDEYIVFQNNILGLYKSLKKVKVDVGILTTTHITALAVLFLSGIKSIIAPTVVDGYTPFEGIAYRMLRGLVTIVPISASKNLHSEYLKLLQPLGINETGVERYLEFSKEAGKNAIQYFTQHSISPGKDFIVAISPSSGNKVKNWPADRFAQVADHVYEKYQAKIVIIGGPNDSEEVSKMLKVLNSETKVVNTLNLFTIDELKAIISLASMFISVDNGPLNIAITFNVPTVDILGPVPEWAVQVSDLNRIVTNRGGVDPAVYPMNTRDIDFKEAKRQSEAITVEMVINEVDSLYTTIQDKKG